MKPYKMIGVGDTLQDAVDTTNNYTALYYMTADAIDQTTFYSSEVEFYSTAIAAVGGALGSTDVAIAAAALAAGTSVWEQRYQRPLRAASYRLAGSEMACFHFKLLDAKNDPLDPNEAVLMPVIKRQVNDVRFRLSQRNINLRPIIPDMTALQAAFKAEQTANAEKPADKQGFQKMTLREQNSVSKDALYAQLQTCVVPESGASSGPAGTSS